MSAKVNGSSVLRCGDVFVSRRLDYAGKPRLVTVVDPSPAGGPSGSVLVDSENQSSATVWRVYVKRTSLLDPRYYTRREASP